MAYEAKNYDRLKGGAVKGLSDAQLDQHFTLYKGYVTKLNEIEEKLGQVDHSKANYSFNEYSELKRRESVAFNGAFLHELYFENLGGNDKVSAELKEAMEAFGGQQKVVDEIKNTAMCGPGWAILTRSRRDGKLHTYFIIEHHIGLPIDQDLLLVVDSWEHAFMVDYGIARAKYLDALVENINWEVVSSRFAHAMQLAATK